MKKLILSLLLSIFLFGSVIFAQGGTTTPAQPEQPTKVVTSVKKHKKHHFKLFKHKKHHKHHKKQKKAVKKEGTKKSTPEQTK